MFIKQTDTWSRELNTDFTLANCPFGVVKLTKNADPNKYGYSGYGTGFDALSQFSLSKGEWSKDVVTFRYNNGSFVHADNRKKDTLVLGESSTYGLDNATIKAEAKYSVNITKSKKKICLSLHYN